MEINESINRVVVKVGSSTLTHKSGNLNIRRIEQLAKVLSDIKNQGKEVILVSSGAVAVGVGKLGLTKKPSDIQVKQACAAIGQCELMYMYDKAFSEYSHNVAQVLITKDVIEKDALSQNVINTFNTLLSFNIIPIVNENDTISFDEIVIGDNDTLSAIVATLVSADLLIILSDIDGLYDDNPNVNKDAKLIKRVNVVDDKLLALAGGKGSELGTGGMVTKLHAASIVLEQDIPMILINGDNPNNLYRIFDNEDIGTLFCKGED